MITAEIIRATKPLVLYPPLARIGERIPVYTIPAHSKLAGAGRKAFIPSYPDSLFRNTDKIDQAWLSQRTKEIAAANFQPQILVVDVSDHPQKDYELAERFARSANQRGQRIDLKQLRTFAYAHDLGRMVCGGRNPRFLETLAAGYHGVIGREIFRHFSERFSAVGNNKLAKFCLSLAKMCSAHTAGIGLFAGSNHALGILPHGKTISEDDLVFGPPRKDYLERLLIAVSDSKNFYISSNFKYDGKIRVLINGQNLIELTDGHILIDKLLNRIILKLGTNLQTLTYRELAGWAPHNQIVFEFEAENSIQTMVLEEAGSQIQVSYNEGKILPLSGFELMCVGGGSIEIMELFIASRAAVHARFDHFDVNNKSTIDRAFEEVIQLVGEENRSVVDDGWLDPERIPG
ncbi:MAG: hypothetical protein KJ732_01770 [Candidatus Margulisbacteria bacterium]|nr:hypothetical protein [Candidatus Margulisiibacteriota bacterium]